jgi:hypothetical protein
MQRKYESALGGILVAAALAVGIIAGCSGQPAAGSPAGQSSTSTSSGLTPSASPGMVTLPASGPTTAATGTTGATGATSATSTSATSTPTGVPTCRTVDLSPEASLVSDSAGAGQMEMNIKLTNTSGHPCTIYGYPGMMLEDQNLSGQATTVTRDPDVPATLLTLADNGSAATTAEFDVDMPMGDEPASGPCEPNSVYLEITPPDQNTQLVTRILSGPVTVCDHGTLNVLPFVAGSTGANQ